MLESDLISTERVFPRQDTSSTLGTIVIDPLKTLWLATMSAGAIVGLLFFASWSAFAVFLVLSAITLCAGHSVGMHRLLIHRSFRTPLWVEQTLVYLGTLVGMAGPFGMIRAHDMRDWHQRQKECPPHPSHAAGFFRDAFWQLCCTFKLDCPRSSGSRHGFTITAAIGSSKQRGWHNNFHSHSYCTHAADWDGCCGEYASESPCR